MYTNEAYEHLAAYTYGLEFSNGKDLFGFIEKVVKEDIVTTLKFPTSRELYKNQIISTLSSISRNVTTELKNSKNHIQHSTEIKNGEATDFYFDPEKKKLLSSRLDIYPTNSIFDYHNKISTETGDFIGKKEVLTIFYEAYLRELLREAKLESVYCRDVDSLLDLFNNPRYKEVREEAILPALSDKAAEQLPASELKFKNITEAAKAYKEDKTPENLAQLKKLHIIKITSETENCDDYEELAKMLAEAEFDCVRRIIIRRLAQLDVANSKE